MVDATLGGIRDVAVINGEPLIMRRVAQNGLAIACSLTAARLRPSMSYLPIASAGKQAHARKAGQVSKHSYSVVLAFFLRRLVCDCATAIFNSGVISNGACSAPCGFCSPWT